MVSLLGILGKSAGADQIIGEMFSEMIGELLRDMAMQFKMKKEDDHAMQKELNAFISKWSKDEFAADPEAMDERTKEMVGEKPDLIKQMTMMSKAFALSYYFGAKVGVIGFVAAPGPIDTAVTEQMGEAFLRGLEISRRRIRKEEANIKARKKEEREKEGGEETTDEPLN